MTKTQHHEKYSTEQRLDAVGLAMSVGVKKAAMQSGIPHSTLSGWMARPDVKGIVAKSKDELTDRLWTAITEGVEQVLTGLRDPKARLSDKARALEVLSQQHALLSGEATSRTESINQNFNASWQPPAGSEPLLTSSEMRLLDRYLSALDKGTAPPIDVTPMLTEGTAQAPQVAPDTTPEAISAPEPSVTLWDDADHG